MANGRDHINHEHVSALAAIVFPHVGGSRVQEATTRAIQLIEEAQRQCDAHNAAVDAEELAVRDGE